MISMGARVTEQSSASPQENQQTCWIEVTQSAARKNASPRPGIAGA